ncbi:PREDICTED: RNA-binding protein 24-like [Camelina sativa]|uniref:RNA-binding protein 24-like n=1 Tax=Camelina sativa TaxID=90675 RepID=A0ABM0VR96_CAMSA|nr:PREDICTED: RNA-binding protein 24-like [Camelina sativa]
MSNTSYYRSPFGDTTHTKVFVGGLAWETPTDEMRRHFDQFGEILEAVIITDKTTGKSKGYGFVTFREPDSATRAVADPNPVIDGRKANCNIASFGRPRPSTPRGRGQGGSPGQYQGGGQSDYTGMAAPLQQAATAQLMYPSYGYTYNSEYGYHQALYNSQLQQAQYYQQQMYGAGATSPSSSNIMPSPYYYLQAPSPRPYPHHHQHYQYHHHQQQQQRLPSASSYLIYPSNVEAPTSSNAPTSQGPLSSSTESHAPQQVSEGGEHDPTDAPESTTTNSRELTSSS